MLSLSYGSFLVPFATFSQRHQILLPQSLGTLKRCVCQHFSKPCGSSVCNFKDAFLCKTSPRFVFRNYQNPLAPNRSLQWEREKPDQGTIWKVSDSKKKLVCLLKGIYFYRLNITAFVFSIGLDHPYLPHIPASEPINTRGACHSCSRPCKDCLVSVLWLIFFCFHVLAYFILFFFFSFKMHIF